MNVPAFAPTKTNVLATALAQTLTRKLANASAKKLKIHAALSHYQFLTQICVPAQTLALYRKKFVQNRNKHLTSIVKPANASAINLRMLALNNRLITIALNIHRHTLSLIKINANVYAHKVLITARNLCLTLMQKSAVASAIDLRQLAL